MISPDQEEVWHLTLPERQRRMKVWKLGIQLFADLLLIVLSADLLYLYHAGAWSDPNGGILLAELVLLSLIILFGIWRIQRTIRIKLIRIRIR